ncbi:kinase [Actinosynnema sp. NPDC020468]|uniref:GHMP family kinase ATP-binding protein n=1 Tax=Actinosynnema sp. NPDC020468 TaxID=3154488 RepID=UPI00340151F6
MTERTAARHTAAAVPDDPVVGHGRASVGVHHGEILQGAFEERGEVHRGLVTLPCDLYSVTATYSVGGGDEVTVVPPWKHKARRAAVATLAALDRRRWGGVLRLGNQVPPARGFGSSTSDVVAAIRAVQNAIGDELTPPEVARLAVQAETASDSLMFDGLPVLFAQRRGIVLEQFDAPLPAITVLGFGTSVDGRGVDTLALPPAAYGRREVEMFSHLRRGLRLALRERDVTLLGQVATESAMMNLPHLPITGFDRILRIARRCGASGVQTAHSGDIAGLIFDGLDPDLARRIALSEELLLAAGVEQTWQFSTER